jgi:hypothetical protein
MFLKKLKPIGKNHLQIKLIIIKEQNNIIKFIKN